MNRVVTPISIIVFLISILGSANKDSFTWPSVVAVKQIYHFDGLPGIEPKVDFNISGSNGRPLYRMLCHSGDYKGVFDLQYSDEQFDFIGAFDCHLFPLYNSEQVSWNLLITDPLDVRDTWSRAFLWGPDVSRECAEYPEFGAIRHIRLRGMQIVFRYSDVVFSGQNYSNGAPIVKSFRLDITVTPDPEAVSSIANQVGVERPRVLAGGKVDCKRVVRRHIPGVVTGEYVEREGLRPPYKEVRAVQKEAIIGVQGANQLVLPIESVTGEKAYSLRCSYQGTRGIDCGLFMPGKNLNLLSDSVDPYSGLPRSLFRPEQLYSSCARYPEWGTLRAFRLRHLKITLRFSNPELSSGSKAPDGRTDTITNVQVSVHVEPDQSASSSVAGPPRYAYWRYLPIESACEVGVKVPRGNSQAQ